MYAAKKGGETLKTGARTVRYERVKSPYGRAYETPVTERFTGIRFTLTTEVIER